MYWEKLNLKPAMPEGCPNKVCEQENRNTCYNCGYFDYIPHQPNLDVCLECKGSGFTIFEQHVAAKTWKAQKSICPSCHGIGKVPKGETK